MRTLAAGDPEWLPSTIVQSSAALVAIIGGFLVSRLVAMTSEHGGLSQRLRELDGQILATSDHHRDLIERRIQWDRADFMASAAHSYFSEGNATRETLAEDIGHGEDRNERLAFADEFLAFVNEMRPKIHDAVHQRNATTRVPASADDLRKLGFEFDSIFESVVDEMLVAERGPYSLAERMTLATIPTHRDDAGRAAELQAFRQLLENIDEAGRQVDDLHRSRELTVQRLAAIKPQGVIGVLITLGIVVAAGIGFPVTIMTLRWETLTAPWRVALAAAFLASVLVVGVHLLRLTKQLNSS